MNANELADKLEKDGEGCTCAAYCAGECACDANWAEYHTKEAATMLRQLQAEISNLKTGLLSHHDIHPVKELTDEEIEEVFYATHFTEAAVNTDFMDFAKAILKKAQEK